MQRDLFPLEPVGITRAIEGFVMVAHHLADVLRVRDGVNDFSAHVRMHGCQVVFILGQHGSLVQDLLRNHNLAHIVNARGEDEVLEFWALDAEFASNHLGIARYLVAVTGGKHLTRFTGTVQCKDRVHHHFAVSAGLFLRKLFKRRHQLGVYSGP